MAYAETGLPFIGDCGKCGARCIDAQLGLERTPDEYVAQMVGVFREVWRVLREDGTVWLNLGDSYATGAGYVGERPGGGSQGDAWNGHRGSRGGSAKQPHTGNAIGPTTQPNRLPLPGLKPKDLVGIPWRVAFALQADGWYLRSDIIWSKPNPMPESMTDRPTRAHEYLFLLAKSQRYYYDAEAIAERAKPESAGRYKYASTGAEGTGHLSIMPPSGMRKQTMGKHGSEDPQSPGRRMVESVATARANGASHDSPFGATRNRRSVWTIPTQPYPNAHFATFPEDLVAPCVLAGAPDAGLVLDPFAGSGTVGDVCARLGRRFAGVELSPVYCQMALRRTAQIGLL